MSKVDYREREFNLMRYDFKDDNPFLDYGVNTLLVMLANPTRLANEIIHQMEREKTKKQRRANYLKSLIKKDRSYD